MLKPKLRTQITAEEMERIAAISKAQYNRLNGKFFKENQERERRLAKQLLKDQEKEDEESCNDEVDDDSLMTDEVCIDVDDLKENKIEEIHEVKSEFIAVVIKEEPTDEFEYEATVKVEDMDIKDEPVLLIEVEDKKISDAFVLLTRLEPEEILRWIKVKQEPELEALRAMLGDESDGDALSDDFFLTMPKVKKVRRKSGKPIKLRYNSLLLRYGKNPVFHCDQCGRTFETRVQIATHMTNHHLSQKFPCPQCHKNFHNAGNFHEF